jgi:hypothetical protein
MPTSRRKPCQFAFVLTTAEARALERVASKLQRSKADTLRFLIRQCDVGFDERWRVRITADGA